jgi:hypothetical protein
VTKRACLCGAVDCQRHGRRAWVRQPGFPGSYGALYQHNREILLRRAGCRPGTGLGGACEICGRPGVPGDPLQADHIVAVADGGGDEREPEGDPPERACPPNRPTGRRVPADRRLHHINLASQVRLAPSRGCGGTTRTSQGLLRDLRKRVKRLDSRHLTTVLDGGKTEGWAWQPTVPKDSFPLPRRE